MSEVRVSIDENVAYLALNAPDRRNAITPDMAGLIVDSCDQINADPEVGAVVVLGEGVSFCAGAARQILDRARNDPAAGDIFRDIELIYEAFLSVGKLRPPTIAAIRGAAVGAGLNLAMAADLRIVARDAQLISGFAQLGVHPGGGHFHLLSRLVGQEAAAAIGVFGAVVSGVEAERLGMAWESLDAEDVEDRAAELARGVGRDPALSRPMIRNFRLEAQPPGLPWDVGVQVEQATQMWSFRRKETGFSTGGGSCA